MGTDDCGRWEAMEVWKKDVDVKLGQFLTNSTATSTAIDELRSMFASFMGKPVHGDQGSPSITHSALDNQGPPPDVSCKGVVAMPKSTKDVVTREARGGQPRTQRKTEERLLPYHGRRKAIV